ncbi:MAG: DUF1580 domain-containing protein [Phycisphaerae bacterium]|nr:DUF1580 domain-containing protein [Phycisphaerae bacterium]
MIDPATEQLFLLTEAPAIINPSHPPHIATIWRWAIGGLKGGVRLESIKVGGQRFTSREAIRRFLVRINEPAAMPMEPSAAAIAAGKKLEEMGA